MLFEILFKSYFVKSDSSDRFDRILRSFVPRKTQQTLFIQKMLNIFEKPIELSGKLQNTAGLHLCLNSEIAAHNKAMHFSYCLIKSSAMATCYVVRQQRC